MTLIPLALIDTVGNVLAVSHIYVYLPFLGNLASIKNYMDHLIQNSPVVLRKLDYG